MGWVLFSFHLQRFYSLVVFDEVRECTWLGSPHVRRQWRIQHMGEHLGESAYSLIVLNERATNESRLLYKKE